MSSNDNLVEVSDVVTRFGDKVVHDRVTFNIRRGEVFAIVGGSGSGKSTVMRHIVMLSQPTAGSIKVFGEEVTRLGEIESLRLRKRIGVMFQYGALFSDKSVLENVGVPLREHTKLDDAFIDELAAIKLKLSNLDVSVAPLMPAELSGGMKKRAALARAIALDPELLVLDEPGSGLDPVSARALDELILQLKELLGLTIVMITHDMNSLMNVADRAVFLGRKIALACDTPSRLAQSEYPEVAEFFAPAGLTS
ncbi:MAG: ATP-binding cassette domain-containing protein [Pseudomonadota bacterium]